jgi:hypothetical protein
MVIRVAAKEGESAELLVPKLVVLFGREAVSVQRDAVHVQLNGNSGQQAITQALASVERWLEQTGIGSADVWVDERRYWMKRPQSLVGPPELLEEPIDLLGGVVMDDPHPDPALG